MPEIVNRAEVIKRSCNSEFLIIVLSSQNSRRWNSESNLKKKEKKPVDDDAHIVVEVFNLDRDAAHLRQTRGWKCLPSSTGSMVELVFRMSADEIVGGCSLVPILFVADKSFVRFIERYRPALFRPPNLDRTKIRITFIEWIRTGKRWKSSLDPPI